MNQVAQKQTGPKTNQGKAISSRNSLSHGLSSRAILLPWEDELDYERHRAKVKASYPVDVTAQEAVVESIVQLQWFLERNLILMNRLMVAEQGKPITEAEINHEIGGIKVNGKSLFDIMHIGRVYERDAKVIEYEQCEKILLGIKLWRLRQAGQDVALEKIYKHLSSDQQVIMQTINSNDFVSIDRELGQFEKDALDYIKNHPHCGWILRAIEAIQNKRVMAIQTNQDYQRHHVRQERLLEKACKYYFELRTSHIDQLQDVAPKNFVGVEAEDVIAR
jgi:hypothetical protein